MTVNYLLMDNRIRLEKQDKLNSQVTELILDNCLAPHISGLSDEFINLEALSIINVGLVTLDGFPKLPNLKRLDVCDNRLSDGLNLLLGCQRLQELNLSGNNFKDLNALEPLKYLRDLINLDLYNCEITKFGDYRQKVFDMLPNLQLLDGFERSPKDEHISPQSPVDQTTKPVGEEIMVESDTSKACSAKTDVQTIVGDVSKETTCSERDVTSMVVEDRITEIPCQVVVEGVSKETSRDAKDSIPMIVDNTNENVICSVEIEETISVGIQSKGGLEDSVRKDKDDSLLRVDITTSENTSCKENEDVSLKVDSASSEKEDSSSRIECNIEDACLEEEDASLQIESENKDSPLESIVDALTENREVIFENKGEEDVPVVDESGRQDSIIEISADHDSSNEEEEADSSENQQELSNEEEEEDITASSDEYDYLNENDLEEGECIDEDDEDEEDELNGTDTHNQTEDISSGEETVESESESGEIQDDIAEQQEEPSLVLQELSGVQQEYGEEQEESGQEVGEGGEEQSGDVEK